MEIRKLEVFCKVVELKSFTRAAEAVYLSQPTVSEHIRSLEQELDQKLLDRMGQQVAPTPAGRLLHKYAVKILRIHQEAIQAVEQYGGKLAGRVAVGCGTIPGTYILPGLISTFRRQHPAIKATLNISSSRIIARRVLDGALDLGVVGAKWNEHGLSWTETFSDQLTLVVHPDHPWAAKQSVSLQQLVTQPFIMRESGSGTRKVIAQILGTAGLREADLQEVAEIGSSAAVKEAVKSGIGVSILSRRAVSDDTHCGKLVTIQVKGMQLERPFYLIRRKNRELSPVAAVFYDYLLQEAKRGTE